VFMRIAIVPISRAEVKLWRVMTRKP